jgi:hypothetical protein
MSMSKTSPRIWFAIVAGVFCLASAAYAQTVELQISGPPSNYVMDGVYVGSYTATNVNTGGSVQITCDDFKDESNYSAYTYNVNTFNSLGSTLWGSYLLNTVGDTMNQVVQYYGAAAWLTETMLGKPGSQQGYYSYAIWAITDASEVASWLLGQNDSTACTQVFGNSSCNTTTHGGLVGEAESQNYTAGEFSNIEILTPEGCSGPGSCKEQEFIEVVAVAEGGSAALYLLLAGAACFAAMFLRSRQKPYLAEPAS